MPLRSERGTGAPHARRSEPPICHPTRLRFVSSSFTLVSFRPISDHPCPFHTFKLTALPISRKTARLPARPTPKMSPWPTPPCPLHSISQCRTGHSRSPLDNFYLLLSYALFFLFFL